LGKWPLFIKKKEKTHGFICLLQQQVDEVIDVKTLQTEINRLQREFAQLGGTVAPTDEALLYFQSEKLSLLLQWCNTVCSFSSIPVINFTSSFSDGT